MDDSLLELERQGVLKAAVTCCGEKPFMYNRDTTEKDIQDYFYYVLKDPVARVQRSKKYYRQFIIYKDHEDDSPYLKCQFNEGDFILPRRGSWVRASESDVRHLLTFETWSGK